MSPAVDRQAAAPTCAKCGAPSTDGDERCQQCGSSLDPSLASTAALSAKAAAPLPDDRAGELGQSHARARPPEPAASASASTSLAEGTMVGEYRIIGELGRGGMGTVYAGEQPVIGKQVAIKVLKAALLEEPEAMERFLAEARAVNTIGHPNIIDIFAFGTFEDGAQYYVMEHLPGRSLDAYLAGKQTMSYADALALIPPVLDALEAAHRRGIVHRDLKPDNIYLADHPDGGYLVKLLDFGIAKFTEEGIAEGRTRTGVPIGTPVYMSPEQCVGEGVDQRSDVYALGVIFYELFAGRAPFEARSFGDLIRKHLLETPTPPSEVGDVPTELEKTILWCLEKDKEDRPEDIDELRQALMPTIKDLARSDQTTVGLHSKPSVEIRRKRDAAARRRRREQRRWPRWLGALLAVLVVGAVVIGWAWQRSSAVEQREEQTVTLQFSVYPADADYQLWVDDELVQARPPLVTLPRSRSAPVRIRAQAEGYAAYEAEHVPLSDGTVPVMLVQRSSTGEAEPTGAAPSARSAASAVPKAGSGRLTPARPAATSRPTPTGSTGPQPARSSQFRHGYGAEEL